MIKPERPQKPYCMPIEPDKRLPAGRRVIDIDDCSDLQKLVDKVKADKVKLSDAYVCLNNGYDGSGRTTLEYNMPERFNPEYDKELDFYNQAMASYQHRIDAYESKMRNYELMEKAYLKWFYAEELKKLKNV